MSLAAKSLYQFSMIFTLSLILMFGSVLATKRLHRKSIGSDFLRGSMLDNDPTHFGNHLPHIIDISMNLKRDALLWDDLKEDGVKIKRCARNVANGKARMYLYGSGLDYSDLQIGAAFIINVEDWRSHCGPVLPAPGIDKTDNVLFYVIDKIKKRRNGVLVIMTIYRGRDVLPSVRIDIRTATEADKKNRKRNLEFYDEISSVRKIALPQSGHDNASLPVLSRPTVSLSESAEIFSGVTLNVDSSLDVSVGSFEFVRLSGITVKWEQELAASASVTLSVAEDVLNQEARGELFRQFIPSLGLGISVPGVGSFGFGAAVEVDWLVEFGADTSVDISYEGSYSLRQEVEAEVGNARISSVKSLASDSGSATGSFSFSETLAFSIGIDGFVGLRPALSVEASVGDNSVGVDVGAKIGLQADVEVQFPEPFQPVTASRTLGNCDVCHHVRGDIAFVGKDLEAASQILVSSLFEFSLGTLCAVEEDCP